MLKARVITTMLWNGTTLVKGNRFNNSRRAGSPITTIKIYNSRDVDEILFFDIISTKLKKDKIDIDFYKELTDECSVPITIGGGIKKINNIDDLLFAGADKISVNSEIYNNPKFLDEAAKKFGSQTIVVCIDFKKFDKKYKCVSFSGEKIHDKNPIDWAKECAERGAGEIILTSIDRDGLMNGYDCELIEKISSTISVPVVASGGAGNYKHMLEAFNSGASAVAASSIFHFTQQTSAEAKKFLKKNNIPVRKNFS